MYVKINVLKLLCKLGLCGKQPSTKLQIYPCNDVCLCPII